MARAVTRSNHQESFIGHDKSYSPIMGLEYPRLLAIATISDLDVIQFDATPACLHSAFKGGIHMGQPDRYVDPRKRTGCGTSFRVGEDWNEELNSYVESEGFLATLKVPVVSVQNRAANSTSSRKVSTRSMVPPVRRFFSCTLST